jgi:hypothetical protein
MKLAIPAVLVTALIAGSPAAFAQNPGSGNTSVPGAGVAKDDTTPVMTKKSKKHMAMHKSASKSYAKHMRSKPSTTGYGNESEPGVGVDKDDTTPKSKSAR